MLNDEVEIYIDIFLKASEEFQIFMNLLCDQGINTRIPALFQNTRVRKGYDLIK